MLLGLASLRTLKSSGISSSGWSKKPPLEEPISGSRDSSLLLPCFGEGDAEPYEGGGTGYWLIVKVKMTDPKDD